jgi:hypothetical protein
MTSPTTRKKPPTPAKPRPRGHEPDGFRVLADASALLAKSLGSFRASVALICASSFTYVEFSRSDTVAVVIGAIAIAAIAAQYFYPIRGDKIDSGPLSPP